MTASATYLCGACGKVASTVTLVQPGQPDPKLTPEPPGVPPGVGTLFSEIFPGEGQLSIDGGPVSISLGPVPMEQVATALDTGDAAALFAIDREYAPFWCPNCGSSYCREGQVSITGPGPSPTTGSSTASRASVRRATSGSSGIEDGRAVNPSLSRPNCAALMLSSRG